VDELDSVLRECAEEGLDGMAAVEGVVEDRDATH
jgi:hypothetical protein